MNLEKNDVIELDGLRGVVKRTNALGLKKTTTIVVAFDNGVTRLLTNKEIDSLVKIE